MSSRRPLHNNRCVCTCTYIYRFILHLPHLTERKLDRGRRPPKQTWRARTPPSLTLCACFRPLRGISMLRRRWPHRLRVSAASFPPSFHSWTTSWVALVGSARALRDAPGSARTCWHVGQGYNHNVSCSSSGQRDPGNKRPVTVAQVLLMGLLGMGAWMVTLMNMMRASGSTSLRSEVAPRPRSPVVVLGAANCVVKVRAVGMYIGVCHCIGHT